MGKIALEAGQVSAELTRRGIAPDARAHVLVEVLDGTWNRRWRPSPSVAAPSTGLPTIPISTTRAT